MSVAGGGCDAACERHLYLQRQLRVGELMQFSPAMNRDQRVKVWVALPILFRAS